MQCHSNSRVAGPGVVPPGILQLRVSHRPAGCGVTKASAPAFLQSSITCTQRKSPGPLLQSSLTGSSQTSAAQSSGPGVRAPPHDPFTAPVMLFVGFSTEEVAVLQDCFAEDITMGVHTPRAAEFAVHSEKFATLLNPHGQVARSDSELQHC